MAVENKSDNDEAARNAANIKLAVGLGLLALVIYAGFILKYYFN